MMRNSCSSPRYGPRAIAVLVDDPMEDFLPCSILRLRVIRRGTCPGGLTDNWSGHANRCWSGQFLEHAVPVCVFIGTHAERVGCSRKEMHEVRASGRAVCVCAGVRFVLFASTACITTYHTVLHGERSVLRAARAVLRAARGMSASTIANRQRGCAVLHVRLCTTRSSVASIRRSFGSIRQGFGTLRRSFGSSRRSVGTLRRGFGSRRPSLRKPSPHP